MIKQRLTVSSGQSAAQKLREVRQRLETKMEAAVGLPATTGQHPTAKMSYARLGAIHEFGAGPIPERSFLRVPLRAAQDQLAADFKRLIPSVISGDMTMVQALDAIGAKASGISQEAITAGIAPPNAPETVRRKGAGKQVLVDQGHLRQAITWVVRQRGL